MPWHPQSKMSLKLEFAMLADQGDANMSALCRRFDISRKTGYKWLNRYRDDGRTGSKSDPGRRTPRRIRRQNRSRRPSARFDTFPMP